MAAEAGPAGANENSNQPGPRRVASVVSLAVTDALDRINEVHEGTNSATMEILLEHFLREQGLLAEADCRRPPESYQTLCEGASRARGVRPKGDLARKQGRTAR